MNEIESQKELISESVKQALLPYVGKVNTEHIVRQIKEVMSVLVNQYFLSPFNVDQIKFEVDPKDDTILIPANMYTMLIMNGVMISYEYVRDSTKAREDGSFECRIPKGIPYYSGGLFVFTPGSSDGCFFPAIPLKFIRATFNLKKDFPTEKE